MTTSTTHDRQVAIEQLDSMIHEIDIAMFTTQAGNGLLRSRPMTTACRRFDGDLWYFTLKKDDRVRDLERNSRVGVTYSCPTARDYVSITGEASIVDDPQKAEILWRDDLLEWFPEGLETEDLVLIKVKVDHAEYWDQHRMNMTQLLSYAKSMITGTSVESVSHEEITWPPDTDAVPRL